MGLRARLRMGLRARSRNRSQSEVQKQVSEPRSRHQNLEVLNPAWSVNSTDVRSEILPSASWGENDPDSIQSMRLLVP